MFSMPYVSLRQEDMQKIPADGTEKEGRALRVPPAASQKQQFGSGQGCQADKMQGKVRGSRQAGGASVGKQHALFVKKTEVNARGGYQGRSSARFPDKRLAAGPAFHIEQIQVVRFGAGTVREQSQPAAVYAVTDILIKAFSEMHTNLPCLCAGRARGGVRNGPGGAAAPVSLSLSGI